MVQAQLFKLQSSEQAHQQSVKEQLAEKTREGESQPDPPQSSQQGLVASFHYVF